MFDDEDSKAVIPVKKIRLMDAEPVKIGSRYCVKWTDLKIYQATVYALGTVLVQAVEQVIYIYIYKHTCWRCSKGSSSEMQDTIDCFSSDDDEIEEQLDDGSSTKSKTHALFISICAMPLYISL